jgi:4-hydroxybenzoate polyprenyltransferase
VGVPGLSRKIFRFSLLVFYNTNTIIVNPTVYLRFLTPYLLYLILLHSGKITIHAITNTLFVMTILLIMYNIAYIINDYYDFWKDMANRRWKRSFVHVVQADFKVAFTIHFMEVLVLLIISAIFLKYTYTIVSSLVLVYLILAVCSIIHSKIYSIKPITFLILRYTRMFSLPLLLYLSKYPFSK